MQVVIGSAFRNSAGLQVKRWLDQVLWLGWYLYDKGATVRAIAVVGDSIDNTEDELYEGAKARQIDLDIRHCHHGGPVYGSIESTERMAALSKVGNWILSGVHEGDDFLVYIESDLIWDAQTIAELIGYVNRGESDIVAPMIFAGENFYDIWAYRKNGQRFAPFPPYHSCLGNMNGHKLAEVDSVGSCLVMRSEIARQIRMTDGRAIVGWCENAREAGYKIAVVPELRIEHPC